MTVQVDTIRVVAARSVVSNVFCIVSLTNIRRKNKQTWWLVSPIIVHATCTVVVFCVIFSITWQVLGYFMNPHLRLYRPFSSEPNMTEHMGWRWMTSGGRPARLSVCFFFVFPCYLHVPCSSPWHFRSCLKYTVVIFLCLESFSVVLKRYDLFVVCCCAVPLKLH